MKKFTLILGLLMPLFCFSNKTEISNPIPYNAERKEYSYSDEINISNMMKSELLKNIYSWAINKYGPSQYLVKYENTIFQKGCFTINPIMRVSGADLVNCYDISYDIKIKAKDGCYKYELCNIKIVSLNEKYCGFKSSIKAFMKNAENCPKLERKKNISFASDVFHLIDAKFYEIIKSMKMEILKPSLNNW